MLSPSPLHRLATQHFHEHYKHKQSEQFLSQPEHTIWVSRHGNFESPIFTFGCFSLKALYNCCKLQRLLQVAKPLFMYYFTRTNIVFFFFQACTYWNCHLHKRLSPDEMFQRSQFFLFLGAGFAKNLPTLLISCEVQTRYSMALKYSGQYIQVAR